MMVIAIILSLAARVEAQRRRNCSIPANDNDHNRPPPLRRSDFDSRNQGERTSIRLYDFAVLKGDETIAARKSIELPDSKAASSYVTELARTINEPGSRILVTNPAGEVEILAGVTNAQGDLANTHAA